MTVRRKSLLERIEDLFFIGDGCWPWVGALTHNGYGVLFGWPYEGKNTRAHRLMYELAVGPIEEGKYVLHHCDTRHCVRPDHLYQGTALDNARDMRRRGRQNYRGGRR